MYFIKIWSLAEMKLGAVSEHVGLCVTFLKNSKKKNQKNE